MNDVDLSFIRKVRKTIHDFYVATHAFRSMEFDWVTHETRITNPNWNDEIGITFQEFVEALQAIQSINTAMEANDSALIKSLWRAREVQY